MNVENVRLWVEDLERNQHPQAQGALCELDADGEPVGYCCLGRACEVAIAHGLPLKVDRDRGRTAAYDCHSTLLPNAVEEWLGVGCGLRGLHSPGTFYGELTRMNDRGATFPEIAQYIRERLGM